MGIGLLGVLLALNLAAVLPALHALWHEGEACEPSDCAVVAFATGSVDAAPESSLPPRIEAVSFVQPLPPAGLRVSVGDCPTLPARAPPA